MSTDLKPCPFCGGQPLVIKKPVNRFQAGCCCPRVGPWTGDCDTEEDAIAAWNTRSDRYAEGFAAGVEAAAKAVTSQGWYRDEAGEKAAEIIRAIEAPEEGK